MKKYILLIFVSFLFFSARAQLSVAYSVGYGSYKMDDMKAMMDLSFYKAQSEYPGIPFGLTSNFPGYLLYTIDAGYKLNKHELGIKASYMTTGGKISYSDYSGEYSDKLIANGYRLAVNYRYYVPAYQNGNFQLLVYGELSPGITFSKLKSDSFIKIGDDETKPSYSEVTDVTTNGFTIMPQIGSKLYFSRNFAVVVSGGYDFEFGAKMNKISTSPRLDWSGLRFNAGVSVTFH